MISGITRTSVFQSTGRGLLWCCRWVNRKLWLHCSQCKNIRLIISPVERFLSVPCFLNHISSSSSSSALNPSPRWRRTGRRCWITSDESHLRSLWLSSQSFLIFLHTHFCFLSLRNFLWSSFFFIAVCFMQVIIYKVYNPSLALSCLVVVLDERSAWQHVQCK